MISFIRRIAGSRRTLIGAATVALMLVLAPASAATAADVVPASAPAQGTSVYTGYTIPDDDVPSDTEVNERTKNYVAGTTFRTLNRWGDAANSFTTKFDGFIGTQLADIAERNMIQGTWMKLGNFSMSVTSEVTQFAVNLDIINGIGAALDNIVKVMLNALIGVTGTVGTGILFGIIALLAVLLAIWRNYRGGMARMAREAGAVIVLVAIVFGIGSNALNYDPGDGDTYTPAPASPGWFVKGINDGITNLTALPAKSFVDGVDSSGWGSNLSENAMGGGLGCTEYTSAMSQLFNNGVSATTTSSKAQLAIAQVTDSLWDSTGLYVWAMTQGGYNNPYAAKVYCRILDFRNGATPGSNAYITYVAALNGGYGASGTALNSAIRTDAALRAPFAPSSTDNTMASIVAWAACKPTGFSGGRFNWAWENGWTGFVGGTGTSTFTMDSSNANSECQKWWEATSPTNSSGDATGGQDIPDIFDIKGDAGWISEHTAGASASVRDFLFGVTGVNPWGGTTGVYAYAAGATLTMLAFLFIDGVVIVAKLFAAMFILSLWFVLIGAMFRPSEMKDRLGKTFNKFLGTAVFAALATLILTFVIVFTRALIGMGIQIWGAGSIGSMLWSGMAPVLTLVLVHIMFTKVFKLPSPVSLRGAQAWSKSGMSGALGAGVGAGVGSYLGTRLGSAAKGAAKRAGSSVVNAGLSKVSGGRLGGAGSRSSMAPASKKPNAAEQIAEAATARAAAGETLTRKEQKTVDTATAAAEMEKSKRDWEIANDQAAKQKTADRADLRSARREYRAETGEAAPGDFLGAAAVGVAGIAAKATKGSKKAAVAVSDKTGLTALRSELRARRTARAEATAARKADVATRKASRKSITGTAAAGVGEAAAAASTVIGGAAGVAKRAAWGVTGVVAPIAAAAPGVATAAATGAAASQTVSMMGGAGGAAALAAAAAATISAMPRRAESSPADALADGVAPEVTAARRGPVVVDAPPALATPAVDVKAPEVKGAAAAAALLEDVADQKPVVRTGPVAGLDAKSLPTPAPTPAPVVAPKRDGAPAVPPTSSPAAAAKNDGAPVVLPASGAAAALKQDGVPAGLPTAARGPVANVTAPGAAKQPEARPAQVTDPVVTRAAQPVVAERTAAVTDPRTPSAVTDVVVPQVQATPVVQRTNVTVTPTGAPVARAVAGPVKRVNVPAGSTVGDVRTLNTARGAAVGAPVAKVTPARIQQAAKPTTVTGAPRDVTRGGSPAQIESAVTPAVNRVANVLNAPAAGVQAVRQKVWKAQDAAATKTSQIIGSKAVQTAVNDARVARAAIGVGAEKVRDTATFQKAEKAAERTAKVIAKGASSAAAGARAVGSRKANNAAVLGEYRQRRAAAAEALAAAQVATQKAADAALVEGKGNTPEVAEGLGQG